MNRATAIPILMVPRPRCTKPVGLWHLQFGEICDAEGNGEVPGYAKLATKLAIAISKNVSILERERY